MEKRPTVDILREKLLHDTRSTSELAGLADVSYFWLRKVRNGTITNPGVANVDKILTLYDVV